MRRRFTSQTVTGLASLAGLALMMSACSDTTAPSSPRSLSAEGGPSLVVGPLQPIPPGSTVININSSGTSTDYCGYNATLAPTFATVFAGGCVDAFDLNTNGALAAYNPGWPLVPHVGSDWVGPQADANRYRVLPGTYDFRTTFHIPAGATAPLLNLSSLSDNVAIIYLNGVEVGRNTPTQDCPAGGPCNWTATLTMYDNISGQFHIGDGVAGDNTLDIFLIDTPIGFGPPGFNNGTSCAQGPQANSPLPDKLPAQGGTWSVAECRNPAAVNFWGTVSYTPPPVTTWCSPGFWKNNGRDLWTAYYTKLYSSLVGAAPLGKKAPTSGPGSNPTLLDVIDNPNIYGGEATNSVADFLSNKAFGTPIGSGVESCPDNVPTLTLNR